MALYPKALPTWGFLFVLTFLFNYAYGAQVNYCSSDNTSGGFTAVYKQFQSYGACVATCQDNYALAVLQDANCWCSNYVPADTVDTSNCNSQCPGYLDLCGNKGKGLFGYYSLTKAVSGTVGSSSPTAAPSTSASSSEAPSSSVVSPPGFPSGSPSAPGSSSTSGSSFTSGSSPSMSLTVPTISFPTPVTTTSSVTTHLTTTVQGSTQSPSTVTSVETTTVPTTATPSSSSSSFSSSTSSQYSPPPSSASTSSSFTSSSSTTSQPASTTTEPPTPFTSVVTQTQEGKTVFSTTLVTPTSVPISSRPPKAESDISHGAIAGIVIGVLAALAALAAILITYYRRRLKEEKRRTQFQDDSGSFGPNSEKYSPMESEGHRWDPAFGIGFMPGRKSQRSSTHLKTTTSRRSTNADTSASPIDRQSMTFGDPRLNPHSFGIHEAGRVSAQSLADHQDYSRPLRVTNGDDPQ